MQWISKSKFDNVSANETRIVTKFLFLPKKINKTWRWLEKVSYQQMCVLVMNYGSMDYGYHKEWLDIAWLPSDENDKVGHMFYSDYFGTNIIVTKFYNDNDWCFKIANSQTDREFKANTPLTLFEKGKKELMFSMEGD